MAVFMDEWMSMCKLVYIEATETPPFTQPLTHPTPKHPQPHQKLHLAEDKYHFQAEEIHSLQTQLQEREQECLCLRAERARHALLLHGLKRELSAYRHKVKCPFGEWVLGGGVQWLFI